MMSKRTQLCINVLITVSSVPRGMPVNTQAIADKLKMSTSHIESILKSLREAGFVQSVRGPGGGYCMALNPDQISIWSVVSTVGSHDESYATLPNSSSLTQALENSLHDAAEQYLCTRTIGEFVKTNNTFHTRQTSMRWAFGVGPKPTSLMPVAPNSVFQLHSFLPSVVV